MQTSVSADGRLVAFRSFSSNLVLHDTNGRWDIFVRDTVAGATRRVSVSSSGRQGNGNADSPAISPDGRCVAFTSTASDLVAGDTNGARDVFVHSLTTGATTRVDVGPGGRQANAGVSMGRAVAVSNGCRMVVFASAASNLVRGDTAGITDIFVRDRAHARTRRISVAGGRQANARSNFPAVSADGSTMAFASLASNLSPDDTNRADDVFVYNVAAGVLHRASVGQRGTQPHGSSTRPALSADGRFVAFQSRAPNLVPRDANAAMDVFVRDRAAQTTERVSLPTGTRGEAGKDCFGPAISADGRFVGFTSAAGNLVAGDTNSQFDGFVRDRLLRTTVRVTLTAADGQAASEAELTALSGDGRWAVFRTAAAMIAADTNGHFDDYERGPLF
jgi:Tol biopolymer transport system component